MKYIVYYVVTFLVLHYSLICYLVGDRDDRDEDGVKRKKKKKKDRDGTTGPSGNKSAGVDTNFGKGGSNEAGDGNIAADGESAIEEELHMMDEITSAEKMIHCQISLMEINRRLCAVIGQPC